MFTQVEFQFVLKSVNACKANQREMYMDLNTSVQHTVDMFAKSNAMYIISFPQ